MIIPVGYGNAVFVFSLSGLPRQMTWSLGYKPDVPGLADPSPAAATIRDAFSATGGPYTTVLMGTDWVFVGVSVTEMTGSGPVVGASFTPTSGERIDQPAVPPNCALLLTKFTARGGRTGRGRAYLPPIFHEDNATSAGFVSAPTVSANIDLYQAAFTTMGTNGFPAYLLHGERAPDPEIAPDLITSISISTLLATQRRRMR